jgi:uncharacterized protein
VRVVFDSNILVSALVFPGKQAERAVLRIIEGQDQLLISKPIVDEVLRVLARKFARDPEELSRVAVFLSDLADMMLPRRRVRVLRTMPTIEFRVLGRFVEFYTLTKGRQRDNG